MSGSYVYIESEPSLYTVGFYKSEKFVPESDHHTIQAAAERANYLNGGDDGGIVSVQVVNMLLKQFAEIQADYIRRYGVKVGGSRPMTVDCKLAQLSGWIIAQRANGGAA